MKCPECGSNRFREARQCPKYQGEPVCTNCCSKCSDYRAEDYQCMWRINHPTEDHSKELVKLRKRLESQEKKAYYYWHRGYRLAAERVESQCRLMQIEIRQLEKKVDQGNESKFERSAKSTRANPASHSR